VALRLSGPQFAGKFLIAGLLLLLAILRLAFHDGLDKRMDRTVLLLLGAAILVILLPWERMTTLKAAGVEITLEAPPVAGALRSLGLDRLEDEHLRLELSGLMPEIEQIDGSRLLWIDDFPATVVALRRLLRALGVEVVMATSTCQAEKILRRDNDFDMIVSDIQRNEKSEQVTFGWLRENASKIKSDQFGVLETTDGRKFYKLHEGVNFIVKLRRNTQDPVIADVPVLFYAAYDWARLAQFTTVALATSPATDISNSPATFVPKAIRMLARSRASQIAVGEEKEIT
jgi:CheY-like chemotaxis protein